MFRLEIQTGECHDIEKSRMGVVSSLVPRSAHAPWFGLILLLLLAVLLGFSTPARIYDERYHLSAVDRFAAGESWRDILTGESQSAAGPVYPIVMAGVRALFGADVRWARAATFGAMCGAIWVMSLFFVHLQATEGSVSGTKAGGSNSTPAPLAGLYMVAAYPMVISGMMALTEVWALVFVVLAFYLVASAPKDSPGSCRLALGGACFAAAVLTRQSTLVLVPALIATVVWRRKWDPVAIFLAGGTALSALLGLLCLWGGMLPPGQANLVSAGLFSVDNFLRGGVYAVVMALLMSPAWVLTRKKGMIVALILVTNVLFGVFTRPVLLTVFPEDGAYAEMFRRVFWGLGLGLAATYLGELCLQTWRRRDWLGQVMCGCVLLVAFSCGVTSGDYSSRYVVLAIPFLLLLGRRYSIPNPKWSYLTSILSVVLTVNGLREYGYWLGPARASAPFE